MKKRFSYIDIAKAIGIILMIAGHIYGGRFQAYIYSFHMPLFFVLSGITMKDDTRIEKMFCKSLWPYITFSGLWFIYRMLVVFTIPEVGIQSCSDAVLSTVMLWGIGNLWFIPCMCLAKAFYMLFSTINKLCPVIVGVGSLLIVLKYFPNGNTYNSLDTVFLKSLVAMLFLSIGKLIIKPFIYRIIENRKNVVFVISVFAILHLVVFKLNGYRTVDLNTIILYNPFFYVVQAVCGSIVIICLAIIINKNKCMEFIGRNSVVFLCLNNFNVLVWLIKNNMTRVSQITVDTTAFGLMLLFEFIVSFFISKYCSFLISYSECKKLFNSKWKATC